MNNILQNLNRRYATKKFDPNKKISQENLDILFESLRLSPSSFGLQPWKFIHVKTPEIRAQLQEKSRGQPQIVEASDLIIIASKTELKENDIDEYMENIKECRKHQNTIENPLLTLQRFKDTIMGTINLRTSEQITAWNQRQAYIAMGFLLETAALMKIDACPMEGFNPAKYDEILGLEKIWYTATVVIAIGYRSTEDKYAELAKVRFPKEKLIIEK